VNQDAKQGLYRVALVATAGYLLHGWRGGIAGVIILFLACSVAQDQTDANLAIAKRYHKG
jgi:hypothetical protein